MPSNDMTIHREYLKDVTGERFMRFSINFDVADGDTHREELSRALSYLAVGWAEEEAGRQKYASKQEDAMLTEESIIIESDTVVNGGVWCKAKPDATELAEAIATALRKVL